MQKYRLRDIIVFFGALGIVGCGVLLNLKHIQASPDLSLVNHFTQPVPVIEPTSTAFSISSVIKGVTQAILGAPVSSPPATSPAASGASTPTSTPSGSASQELPENSAGGSPMAMPGKKVLPYSVGVFDNGFANGDGWDNWWGDSSEENGVLVINANDSSTGGGALLSGSDAWTNLTFTAHVDWNQGETFGLVAHYIDDKNYLVCQYDEKAAGDVHVRLDEHLNGNVIHLADGDVLNYEELGGADIPVGIQIQGNQGVCEFNGYIIGSSVSGEPINPSLSHGKIGFTSWDPTLNNSKITVHTIGVMTTIYSLGAYIPQSAEQ